MKATVGLAQCSYPDDGDVLAQVACFADEAVARGVGLLMFPEGLMCPRSISAAALREAAQTIDGPFVRGLASVASSRGLWILATLYETDPAGGAPYNTAIVLDEAGELRGTYRKCHLYDAHDVRESERTQAGDVLFEPLDTPVGRLGMGICYDLRFPEVARSAALAGCQLVAYPSAWIDGPQKAEHWRTLLRARAIENELFVLGVCRAGDYHVGHSLVSDPMGRVVAEASGKGEELVVCTLDLAEIASTRDAMPLLMHRRPELY